MRITSIGKVAILVVVLGIIGAGYRYYANTQTTATNQTSPSNSVTKTYQSNSNASLTLAVQTSGTYQDYLEKLASQWQAAHSDVAIKILPPKESRDALHFLLDQGKSGQESNLPDVWLASNDALVQNLNSAMKSRSSSFANVNDTRTYAIWPPQPMVALCKVGAQSRVAAAFNMPNPFANLGGLKFSFPDPLTSGGGHAALGYCAWDFKQQKSVRSFEAYLRNLQGSGYIPLAAPSGGLASDFANCSLDFILIHNALADREIAKSQGTLAKVVPSVTVWERPSAIALRPASGWSGEKEKALQDFTEFIRRNPPFSGSNPANEAQVPEHLDTEKLTWERVFDQGARVSNINAPSNLQTHPR